MQIGIFGQMENAGAYFNSVLIFSVVDFDLQTLISVLGDWVSLIYDFLSTQMCCHRPDVI